MFCTQCNHELADCTCPDLQERLASLTMVAIKFCKLCDQHYARCKCPNPEWEIRGGPRE